MVYIPADQSGSLPAWLTLIGTVMIIVYIVLNLIRRKT